jgi:signal peptidase I
MQFLTSLVLAAFVGYAGSWYLGFLEGNFALLLLLATVVTGIYWLAERFFFLPQRQKAVAQLEAETAQRRAELTKMGIDKVDTDIR